MARRVKRAKRRGVKGIPKLSHCAQLVVTTIDKKHNERFEGQFRASKKGWEYAKAYAKRKGRGGKTAIVTAERCKDKRTGRVSDPGAYVCNNGHCSMNAPLSLSGTKKRRKPKKRKSLRGTKRRTTKRRRKR